MIRSIRKVLTAVTNGKRLDDVSFYTLLTGVERILNNRPITPVGDDPKDISALKPGMLLNGRLNPDYPPDIFFKADGYRKSWKLVQTTAIEFWSRWVKEYMQLSQTLQKWHQPVKNFAVGDMVLVVDQNTPRGLWPVALSKKFIQMSKAWFVVKVQTARSPGRSLSSH